MTDKQKINKALKIANKVISDAFDDKNDTYIEEMLLNAVTEIQNVLESRGE